MAYDASNNKQDENQVVSSTPLSSGQQPQSQPAQGDSQASQAPSQPSTVQAGMSSTQAGAAQQPQQSNKPASSGMFTNIQKYVSKNKPQAQKMAGAVTQDVGQQASQIADQAKQKEAQMKESLQANTAAMEAQKKEAGQMVQNIMGTNQRQVQEPQPFTQKDGTVVNVGDTYKSPITNQHGQITGFEDKVWEGAPTKTLDEIVTQPTMEEQQARYQELMKGPTGLTEVGGLNLAEQSQKARALQQMAGQAGTEMGRRQLLQDTFRKQGEYTSGMGGLDQLITSGDDQAREQLVTGVQEQAQGLQDQLQTVGSEANKSKMAQDMAMKNFGADISQLGADAQQQIMEQVNAEVTNQQTLLQQELDDMKFAAQSQFNQKYADENAFYKSLQDQFSTEWSKAGNRNWQDRASLNLLLNEDYDMGQALRDRGVGGATSTYNPETGAYDRTDMSADQFKNITLGSQGAKQLETAFKGLLDNAADFGLDTNSYMKQLQDLGQAGRRKDVYGWSGHQNNKTGDIYSYDADKFKEITSGLFSDMAAAKKNALQRQLENKYGLGAEGAQDFLSGKSIDAAGVATQEQADRMASLRNLMGGQTDLLGTELGDSTKIGEDTAFFQRLKEGLELNKNRPEVQTGGTVDSRGATGGGGGAKKVI